MPFQFKQLKIPDVLLISPIINRDDRGFFMETFKKTDFKKVGIDFNFCQDNHSKSKKGVIRGLHYQIPPMEQGKLIRVIRGSLLDVVVDIRKNSPCFGKYIAIELSENNQYILWIPPGFAHGICIMEDDTELLYKCTSEYSPQHERGILWNDPTISINWPITDPILSEKDTKYPRLTEAKDYFSYENNK